MRLFIQYEKDNQTGKGKFFRRIVPHLEALGVKCFYHNSHCDITLAPIRFRENTNGIPRVLRVDGIHILDTKQNRGKNETIKNDIKESDAIIWQSDFSRHMVRGILGVSPKRTESVIFNGADPVPPFKGDNVFRIIMSAKWVSDGETRPHKRLHDMVAIVDEYVNARPNKTISCVVAGKTDLKSVSKNVHLAGHMDERDLNKWLAKSDVMLNLCWYDWCPNAVVEAICAGVPVICGNNGGVPEIVGKSGIVLDIDKPMQPEYLKPVVPSIMGSKQLVFDALDRVVSGEKFNMARPELTAEYAARKYKELFERVLK